jgi:hypothetical protein
MSIYLLYHFLPFPLSFFSSPSLPLLAPSLLPLRSPLAPLNSLRSFHFTLQTFGPNLKRQGADKSKRRRDELREGFRRLKEVLPATTQRSSKSSLLDRCEFNFISSLPSYFSSSSPFFLFTTGTTLSTIHLNHHSHPFQTTISTLAAPYQDPYGMIG